MAEFTYRCSICREEVPASKLAQHVEEERQKPDWPGHMSWTLVGGEFDTEREE